MSFFNNKNDFELTKRAMLYEPDFYGSKIEHEQESSVLDSSTTSAATFTLDTGVVTADDVFNSTALKNLYFLDDNSALAKVEIDDSATSGNTVTFDSTAAVLVSDESTAPTLTDTSSYQVRVLQASALTQTFGSGTIPVGKYIGHTSDANFNYTNNKAKLKVGVPKRTVTQGTVEVEAMLEFNYAQITDPNMLKSGLQGATYGDQTNQTQVQYGFNPQTSDRYMIQAYSLDDSGRAFFMEFFNVELTVNAFPFGGDEYKKLGITGEILADTMRLDNYNMMRSISLD